MSRIFSENDCAICLDSVDPKAGRALFMAECSHTFHFECIASNVQHGNRTCPLCRANWKQLPFETSHSHLPPLLEDGAATFPDDDFNDDDDDEDGDYVDDEDSWVEQVFDMSWLDEDWACLGFVCPQPPAPPPTDSGNATSLLDPEDLLQLSPPELPLSRRISMVRTVWFDHDAALIRSISEWLEQCLKLFEKDRQTEPRDLMFCLDPDVYLKKVTSGMYGRQTAADGMSGAIELCDLYVHEERDVLVDFNVPPDANGETAYLLKMRCRHKHAISGGSIELDEKELKVLRPEKANPVERAAYINRGGAAEETLRRHCDGGGR